MKSNPDLAQIEEEVKSRFQPANPISEAIAEKLARTLYLQRRCDSLVQHARAYPTLKLDQLPPDKQKAFRKKIRELVDRSLELKRAAKGYSNALNVKTQKESGD